MAGTAAFGRHLAGWRSLLSAAALASGSPGRGAAPCGLAAGSRHLRPSRGRLPLAGASWAAGPCNLAAAPCGLATTVRACGAAATTGGRPLQGA
ncbi:hypothetical protein BHE74_00012042 [Ensete ventricosum]|nr:hypothetical protein BHE74_00012042 [Ensete ventricosum]RZR78194.1 hypothetical protein BHM03_00003467 [Ensete ventricosum]